MKRIPSQEETFQKLGPIKDLMYEILVSAIAGTKEHFKQNDNHSLEKSHFFSVHVRESFLTLLKPESEAYNFSIADVPSSGFLLTYGNFACKFYKAYNGGIPLPHDSKTLRDFYSQNSALLSNQPTLPFLDTIPLRQPFPSTTINLIIYYDVNAHYELAWLRIACPKYATTSRVECFWDKLVENPLENGGFQIKQSTKERKDLSFELRNEDISTELG